MCDRVDPSIRRGLRVPEEVTMPDAHTACGAVVVTMAMDTGEGSGVAPPATIAGAPRAAATHGNTSIVAVDVRYGPMPTATVPQPPPRATIKVLVAGVGRRRTWASAHFRSTVFGTQARRLPTRTSFTRSTMRLR
jgi:hypothetical protein